MASLERKFLCLLLAGFLLLPLCASAQTLDEWNQSTMWVIKEKTELYQQNDEKKVITTLEKDARVVLITSKDDYAVVDARLTDGQIVRGQVLRSRMTTIFSDLQFIFNEDGSLRSLEDVKSPKKGSEAKVQAAAEPSVPKAAPENDVTDEDTEAPFLDEKTDELTEAFDEQEAIEPETPQEDQDRVFYVIYAPKGGKATLREKADKRAAALGTCLHGKVVELLEKGEDFALIVDDGKQGYVLADCVQEHQITADVQQGCLVLKGKTDGKDHINIRQKATKSSTKLRSFPTGTELTVISEQKEWAEILIGGMYGFVQSQYVQLKP